jgi:hypothetical protein
VVVSDAVAIQAVRRQTRELADGTLEVKLHVQPYHKADFHRLFPEIDTLVALAPLVPVAVNDAIEAVAEAGNSGGQDDHDTGRSIAQRMHITGYFRSPELWLALHRSGVYTLQAHKRYVEAELACIMPFAGAGGTCSGDVCLHHARGAELDAAGKELQPEAPLKVAHWYGIPLCHAHHMGWVHASASREDHQRLKVLAVNIMAEVAKRAVKGCMGLASLRDVSADDVLAFEESVRLDGLARRMGVLK